MKAKGTKTVRKAATTRRSIRKPKLRRTPGAKATTRRSELIDRAAGYTGDRGNARSATSGIP
jgi:hypothetical protein